MHNFGCRVIQRVLEYCPEKCTDPLYDLIINENVLALSKDQFGNYVIQLILEKGVREKDKSSILHSLLGEARSLSVHKFSSNVIEKCIQFCAPEDKALIVQELLGEVGKSDSAEIDSIYKMMDNKYGNYVVQKALEEASPQLRSDFNSKVKNSDIVVGQSSNYVKHVINCLDRLSLSEFQASPANGGSVHTGQ
jgi:pumilio RNA-binding family